MLRSLNDIEDYKVNATDGGIGSVSDFYFDDHDWTIRYLAVETGGFWEGPSRVLVSPIAFGEARWDTRRFQLSITRDKVRNSPLLARDAPLSRQYESAYYQYYDWPCYWGYGGIWGVWGTPGLLADKTWTQPVAKSVEHDSHLHKIGDVLGCRIHGSDAVIGVVKDFIVDDESWIIRYMVVDTGSWWAEKNVILATHWIGRIDDRDEMVHVDLLRETIKKSPEWSPEQPVNRDYEARLFDYYGRPVYWADDKHHV